MSAVTVRDWRRAHRIPRMWWLAIRALVLGDLGAICERWRGWRIEAGHLHAPDGGDYVFTPGEVCAMRHRPPVDHERELEDLRSTIRHLRAALDARDAFPMQADWVAERFERVPDPPAPVEERYQAAVSKVELLEHRERVRASEPRPRYFRR